MLRSSTFSVTIGIHLVAVLLVASTGIVGAFDEDVGALVEASKLMGYPTGPGAPGDEMSRTIVLQGDTLLVGVKERPAPGCAGQGVVVVYERQGGDWLIRQIVNATSTTWNPVFYFGGALAADGDTMVVGNDSPNGGAYVFDRNRAGEWSQTQDLEMPPAAVLNYFGQAVAIEDDTLMVSATDEPVAGVERCGAVHVFGRTGGTWSEQETLAASDYAEWAAFGNTLALDGATLIVGSNRHGTGAAYVFEKVGSEWVEQQKLTPSDQTSTVIFGTKIAIEDDMALVSAPWADGPERDNGAVYCFRRVGGVWHEQQKLTASDAEDYASFGRAIALLGETLFVADNDSVYVFGWDGGSWAEHDKLGPSDPSMQKAFGNGVSLNIATAAIGAPGDDQAGANAGAIYIFEDSGSDWLESHKLLGVDSGAYDEFGRSVAVWRNTAVVGAQFDEHGVGDAGAVYFFERSGEGWNVVDKVVAHDGAPDDRFGRSVAVHESTALIGAFGSSACGAAYVFERYGAEWIQTQKLSLDDVVSCSGFGGLVELWGDTALATATIDNVYTVCVFEKQGPMWTEIQRLIPLPGDAAFSRSVALFTDTLAIGSPLDDEAGLNAGAVHVYTRQAGDWIHDQKLLPSSPPLNLAFGRKIAMWGDLMAVVTSQTEVRVYRRDGAVWVEEAALTPPGTGVEAFGEAIAISPGRVIVGAPLEDIVNTNSGAVYSYTYDDGVWSAPQLHIAADTEALDELGAELAIWMDHGLFSAPQEDELDCRAGAVYVFEGPRLFVDGFEDGGTSLWSSTTN